MDMNDQHNYLIQGIPCALLRKVEQAPAKTEEESLLAQLLEEVKAMRERLETLRQDADGALMTHDVGKGA